MRDHLTTGPGGLGHEVGVVFLLVAKEVEGFCAIQIVDRGLR